MGYPTNAAMEIKRKVVRYRAMVKSNSEKFDGKEQDFTFHGGFTSGYAAGKLAAYEELADMLGVNVDG